MEAVLDNPVASRSEIDIPHYSYIPLSPKEVKLEMPVLINSRFAGIVVHALDEGKFINVQPFEQQAVSGLQMIMPNVDTIEHIVVNKT